MRKSTTGLKPKEWRDKRDKLQELLRDTVIRPTRILNGTFNITLEGGRFPATYSLTSHELTIWSRAARHSGGSITIGELQNVEDIIMSWQQGEFSE